MMRRFEEKDILESMDLWEEHFNKVSANFLGSFNRMDTEFFLASLIKMPTFVCYVWEDKEKVTGIIAWVISVNPYNSTEGLANEIFWYSPNPKVMIELYKFSEKEVRKDFLISGFNIGIPDNPVLEKWLRNRDYVLSRKVFMKSLEGKK